MVVEKGSLTDVQFMLETCRANINTTTYTGCTPLHIASGRGDIALTAYLLSMGANPDLATDEGDTALDLAGSDQVCVGVLYLGGGGMEVMERKSRATYMY